MCHELFHLPNDPEPEARFRLPPIEEAAEVPKGKATCPGPLLTHGGAVIPCPGFRCQLVTPGRQETCCRPSLLSEILSVTSAKP